MLKIKVVIRSCSENAYQSVGCLRDVCSLTIASRTGPKDFGIIDAEGSNDRVARWNGFGNWKVEIIRYLAWRNDGLNLKSGKYQIDLIDLRIGEIIGFREVIMGFGKKQI